MPRRTSPRAAPLLVFDGDCGFCRRWVARWRGVTGDAVEYRAAHEAASDLPEVPTEAFAASVVLAEPDGRLSFAAEAVFRTLAAGGRRWPLALYERLPGVRAVTEAGYRFVASHRRGWSLLDRLAYGAVAPLPGFRLSSWLFLRLLALVHLAAFLSFWAQARGLVGERGILPVGSLLASAREQLGGAAAWRVPTVFWLGASDRSLDLACGAGVALSLLLLAGLAQPAALVGLWALALSVTVAGQTFTTFQWDALLIETTLLSILLAPWTLRPTRPGAFEPPPVARWLLWWLLFRLVIMSGVVKLISGDPTWRDLTALAHHHETQPLPTALAWHLHHLPLPVHRGATLVTFALELALPFLIAAPRRLRHLAALGLVALQAAIALSGSYGIFNVLSAALALLLLDDGAFPRSVQAGLPPRRALRLAPRLVLVPFAVLALTLTTVAMLLRLGLIERPPAPLAAAQRAAAPFMSFNAYGLFAVMTTVRDEVVLEGSDDGTSWREYELPWKPGDPGRRPRLSAPHMPRLDWRLWFAPLGPVQRSPWLFRVEELLLRGSPDVVGLFAGDPFDGRPPRFVRALSYRYRFTTPEERRLTSHWWTRELLGPFGPATTLAPDGRVVPAGRPR